MTALLRVSLCIQQRTETLRPSFTSPPKCLMTSAMETVFASEEPLPLFLRTTLDQSCAGIRSLLYTSRASLWQDQSCLKYYGAHPTYSSSKSLFYCLLLLWLLYIFFSILYRFFCLWLWVVPTLATCYLSLWYWH